MTHIAEMKLTENRQRSVDVQLGVMRFDVFDMAFIQLYVSWFCKIISVFAHWWRHQITLYVVVNDEFIDFIEVMMDHRTQYK